MKNIAETLKKNFLRISEIPRGSGHEDKIADFFVQVAREGGGIECASIKKRFKGLDIISIGGTIKDYHTTGETTYVSSWVKIYELLAELLTLCSSEE